MKTFTTYFSSKDKLALFLADNNIFDNSSLLIQVFTPYSDRLYIQELLNTINSLLPLASLIGSTTDGEVNDGILSKDETVLSFTLFAKTTLTTYISNNFENFFQAGENLALNLIENDTKVIISFLVGSQNDNKNFLNGMKFINTQVKITTALAGSQNTFAQAFVFNKTCIYTDAVVAIALHSTQLQTKRLSNHCFKTIGESFTVTKAVLNRVYKINDKTAYDAYAHYLGENIAKQLPAIGIDFPLVIEDSDANLAHVAIEKKEDGSLLFTGNFEEGDKVKFAFPDTCKDIEHSQTHKDERISSILMSTCFNDEIKSSYKNAHVSGFFTYGKLYNSKKSKVQYTTPLILNEPDLSETISNDKNIIEALSHLVHITSKELKVTKYKMKKQLLENTPQAKDTIHIKDTSAKSKMYTLSGSDVLLTEDNKTNQKIIQGILKESGIKLDIANNGQEAIDALKNKEYELILMDVQMPLMGGLEAAQRIRTFNKNIPIIALTASNRPRDIQDTQLAGMNEHLIKPINVEKLFITLLKYISKKVDSKNTETIDGDIVLPNFKYININLGLTHLGEDKALYIKILQDFAQRYKNINLEFLSNEEYDRVLHTIRGLSSNIGATALNKSTYKLHFHVQDSITAKFYTELHNVIGEIQTLLKAENNQEINQKKKITKKEQDYLFQKLKNAIEKERPQLCAPLIEDLSQYKFNAKDKTLLDTIKRHVNEFDFDEALIVISKVY